MKPIIRDELILLKEKILKNPDKWRYQNYNTSNITFKENNGFPSIYYDCIYLRTNGSPHIVFNEDEKHYIKDIFTILKIHSETERENLSKGYDKELKNFLQDI